MKIRSHLGLLLIMVLAFFLRVYKLGSVPISLHGDEIGVGYNAYSLYRAGIDEYGKSWPLTFRADVTPIIFYATVPSIAVFGLHEMAVRLPSVLIGTITVGVFYFFVVELIRVFLPRTFFFTLQKKIGLLSALFMSIAPWHIQLSRITHDASYGILLQLIALIGFFLFIRLKKKYLFLLSCILFGISFYAYHSPRITSPLFLTVLCILFRNQLPKRILLIGWMLFFVTILPITADFFSKPLAQTRFGGVNIFIRQPNSNNSILGISVKFLVNFITQYDPTLLFINSEPVRYFNVYHVGLIHLVLLPFIVFCLAYLFFLPRLNLFLYGWFIIAILPGALTLGIPNAGRNALLFPLLEMLSAMGIILLFTIPIFGNHTILKKMTISLVLFSTLLVFLNQYFTDSPKRFARQWQYGTKELVQKVISLEINYDQIIISNRIKQAYIYILFYGNKSPQWLSQVVPKQRNNLVGYDRLGKYIFRDIDWSHDYNLVNTLIVGTPDDLPISNYKQTIRSFDNSIIYGLTDTVKISKSL